MGPVPVETGLDSYERQLAQLLGAKTAARADLFAVQAILDQNPAPVVISTYRYEAVLESPRRQAEQLPHELVKILPRPLGSSGCSRPATPVAGMP